jgi:hypothetical protein
VSSTKNVDTFVLICVASLVFQSPISLNIYNRHQDINLTSPVYFIHGGKWHVAPDQEIGVMQNYLEFDSGQDILEGALVYGIQRKQTESDKLIQNEPENIQLLVAWHAEYTNGLDIRALLVEHDKGFNWDEDKLKRLYQRHWHPLDAWVDFIGNDWLLNNATVLRVNVNVMNGGYRWDIVIYEGERVVIEKPLWVDTER